MKSALNCSVTINLDGGDGEIIVSDKNQTLIISIGLAAITLRNFFSDLNALYTYKKTKFKLEHYGSADYYLFVRDSNVIRIEEVRKPGGRDIYKFNLMDFLFAFEKGFQRFFAKLRKDGVLPSNQDKDDFMYPVNNDVTNSFDNFSKSLKH
ncbi:hypothetical protein [Priestia megaterium]|uniref:Uncharacterized protein n=1 Tax=Priestia megaterium TaxID=1404 RepID=A0ABD4WWK6_PRIMG|nr:hypothetical protein [Priestia megaterium]MBV6737746.1 hypothetical protein [Priestia megaterium]MDD9784633.1 hypothetical protein [Priestia megaterium]QLC90842.1 hypothetical protein HW576_30375 [Priestia megaterium]